jgi:hypothetical protein
MRKVTITGWSEDEGVISDISYWPEAMETNLCIAKAVQDTSLNPIKLVEVEENGDGE